jgi:N-acetylglucosamine kinase-like BadF-type ATPase
MISQYAPLVEKAAALGDPTALRILHTAAERLFTGVDVVARQMNLGDAPYVVLLWGSVLMKNAYVSGRLKELLLERFPNAEIVNLEGTALDCALNIALNIGKEQAPCKNQS